MYLLVMMLALICIHVCICCRKNLFSQQSPMIGAKVGRDLFIHSLSGKYTVSEVFEVHFI